MINTKCIYVCQIYKRRNCLGTMVAFINCCSVCIPSTSAAFPVFKDLMVFVISWWWAFQIQWWSYYPQTPQLNWFGSTCSCTYRMYRYFVRYGYRYYCFILIVIYVQHGLCSHHLFSKCVLIQNLSDLWLQCVQSLMRYFTRSWNANKCMIDTLTTHFVIFKIIFTLKINQADKGDNNLFCYRSLHVTHLS